MSTPPFREQRDEATCIEQAGKREVIQCRTVSEEGLDVVASRSHGDAEALDKFLDGRKVRSLKSAGSPWPGGCAQATVPNELPDAPLARADVAAEKRAATVRRAGANEQDIVTLGQFAQRHRRLGPLLGTRGQRWIIDAVGLMGLVHRLCAQLLTRARVDSSIEAARYGQVVRDTTDGEPDAGLVAHRAEGGSSDMLGVLRGSIEGDIDNLGSACAT